MMLDCKMNSSLSPATPGNIFSEGYGNWDQETLNPIGMKMDSSDILEFMDSNLTSPSQIYSNSHSAGYTHNENGSINRESHYQSPHYLTPLPLPSLTTDPYAPTESHMLDSFHSLGSVDSSFQKLVSEACSSMTENYDTYIPDLGSIQTNQSSSQLHSPEDLGGGTHLQNIPSSLMATHETMYNPHVQSSHNDYLWDDFGDPAEYFCLRKGESPASSESVLYRDADSEVDSKSSGESLETLKSRLEDRAISPPKRRVGRPPKKDKKLKRLEKRTGRLWEFIRDLLKNPDYCPSLVRWENPDEGHFRFVNSEKVAQLWGQIKGNPRMTYEKLSRAMRYYYKSHVFEPVLGRRLVYKFGCNAVNWRPINPNFVQKLYT